MRCVANLQTWLTTVCKANLFIADFISGQVEVLYRVQTCLQEKSKKTSTHKQKRSIFKKISSGTVMFPIAEGFET